MRFLVLGPLEVLTHDGRPLVVRAGRTRYLLHSLLLNRRVVQPVETLVERLWEEDPPTDAANGIHQLVSHLRRTWGEDAKDLLQTTPVGYRLDIPDDAVDAWEMERLVQQASAGLGRPDAASAQDALGSATTAVQLWRGEPYSESAHFEWTAGDRTRLQDMYLHAQELRVDALLQLGRHREAVLETQSLSAAYPLREKFHAQLALALYRSGRQSEALEVHRAVRELLAGELGLDPGHELKELERAILQQDESLDWRPPGEAVAVAPPQEPAPPTIEGQGRSPAAAPLPASAEIPLVGREREEESVRSGVLSHRLYTLTGPAGVGKSRLALAVAHGADGPVWYVDLDGVLDDAHVPAAVASALGAAGAQSDVAELVVDALRAARGLLVLDNCEAVVGGAGELVQRLFAAAPGVSVLATSRRPLGVLSEVAHRLLPLPVPDADEIDVDAIRASPAVQLWLERARSLNANLRFDEEAVIDVAGIVRQVDGLPMAIELAAGHADVSSTGTIRRRLESHLNSLAAANFPLGGRSPSLTAAIEASLVLLSDDERRFLLSLSVFPSSFDSGAAASVTGLAEEEAFGHLTSLVRHSLVTVEDPYRLLSPVRAYVGSRAASELDLEDLRRRHAAWVSAVATESWHRTGGLRHTAELAALRPLMLDARVALQWALANDEVTTASRIAVGFAWVWTLHGRTDEGFSWLAEVKALSDRHPPDGPEAGLARAAVLRSLGLIANPRGELELARAACVEASELALRHGDEQGAAAALLTLTVTHWALGDFAASADAAARAAELEADRRGSWYFVAAKVLGARTALDDNVRDARELVDEAVEVAREAADPHMLGLAFALRARFSMSAGAPAEAAVAAGEALRLWEGIRYTEGEIMALNLLARIQTLQGDPREATSLASRALRVADRTGHRGGLCESMETLAIAAAAEGRREHALLLLLVSERERGRRGIPVPAADRRLVRATLEDVGEALGSADALVRARAQLTSIEGMVAELLH